MKLVIPLLLLVAAVVPLSPALAQDASAGLRVKAAGYGEDARDLGLAQDPEASPQGERDSAYLDVNPYLHLRFGEDGAAFTRLQLFTAAGDEVVQNEDELPVASDQYLALRELWLEYGGITTFPGEVLRLGLQRVREQDGMWWDRDIESVRWIFDTTLVQAHVGVGEQFGTYRTDDVELSPSQRDRAYVFGSYVRQSRPGAFYGVRAAYAQDHGALPEEGTTEDPSTKMHQRQYLWVAVRTENGFYDPRSTRPMSYWFEVSALSGRRESAQTDAAEDDPTTPENEATDFGTVIGYRSTRVAAFAADVGARARLPLIFPLNIGGMYGFAQGESTPDWSHRYEPTGLESNRSRYTGTRTLINRFNEALAADFSNLMASSFFLAMPYEMADASVVYHRFMRQDGSGSFTADGIDAAPVTNSRDIGSGWDLVLTRYFRGFETEMTPDDDDARSNLRLRASRFEPGRAFGDDVRDLYRVTLEATLWF